MTKDIGTIINIILLSIKALRLLYSFLNFSTNLKDIPLIGVSYPQLHNHALRVFIGARTINRSKVLR